jgi:hypothetical protein
MVRKKKYHPKHKGRRRIWYNRKKRVFGVSVKTRSYVDLGKDAKRKAIHKRKPSEPTWTGDLPFSDI